MKKTHITISDKYRDKILNCLKTEDFPLRDTILNDIDYLNCVGDLLSNEEVQSMKNYIQHGTTSCLCHCLQVSYLSYLSCKKKGLDYKSAARAGLLHDYFLYDWHLRFEQTGERFHGFKHGRIALRNASKNFSLSPLEKNIILHHMWPLTPIPPNSLEGMVIVYYDKYCSLSESITRFRQTMLQSTD